MSGRILFGLDRLPRTMAPDDPRLRSVPATGPLLRLNTEPLPLSILATLPRDHAGRLGAARALVASECGDYARPRERFVTALFDWAEAAIAAARPALTARLAPFAGLFAPEDFLWSAPRPLPRAWAEGAAGYAFADVIFRLDDGPLAVLLGETPAPPGLRHVRLGRDAPEPFFRATFGAFWESERLPRGAFRRPFRFPAPGPAPLPAPPPPPISVP